VFFGDVGAGSPKGTELDNGGYLWAVTGVGNTAGSCKLKWDYNNWPLKGKSGTMTGVWDPLALAQESDGTWAVVFGTVTRWPYRIRSVAIAPRLAAMRRSAAVS